MSRNCRSAVALIIFNRPEPTARVFAAVRAARPPTLFIIADGPRVGVANDAGRCAETRAVVEQVDWPCQVFQKIAPVNLGLRRNVSEGLDWVFENTEEAIILEDDCCPDPSFFPFCDELLARYRDSEEVGVISGANLSPDQIGLPDGASYYFSRYCHVWGWATWRRVWRSYDREMAEWPSLARSGWLNEKVETTTAVNFWRRHFDDCVRDHPDGLGTWDIQLVFALWRQNLLSIVPRKNLITNLGFGPEALHTRQPSRLAAMETGEVTFPLVHPSEVAANREADEWVQANVFEGGSKLEQIFWTLRLPLPIWTVRRAQRWLTR